MWMYSKKKSTNLASTIKFGLIHQITLISTNKIIYNKFIPTKIDIKKIVQETSINNLKKEERLFGFNEASKYSRFFRSGRTEQWKDILSLGQIKLIEKELYPMMKQFNYL